MTVMMAMSMPMMAMDIEMELMMAMAMKMAMKITIDMKRNQLGVIILSQNMLCKKTYGKRETVNAILNT